MKLRLGKAKLKLNEDTELPDFSFNHAFVSFGNEEADIMYLIPSSKEDVIKSQASEIAGHLMGRYK
jgi:hypothetical protein